MAVKKNERKANLSGKSKHIQDTATVPERLKRYITELKRKILKQGSQEIHPPDTVH
ncbi:hypothetical protein MKX01_021747, partial [Papaver californicum]